MEQLPSEIVMTAEDMVDASLAGLDQHERLQFQRYLISQTGRSTKRRAKLWVRTFPVRNRRLVMGFRAEPIQ